MPLNAMKDLGYNVTLVNRDLPVRPLAQSCVL